MNTRRGIYPHRQHTAQEHCVGKPRIKLRDVTYATNIIDRHFANFDSYHKDHSKRVKTFVSPDTPSVYLPPLRERLEDIPLLANHFLHTIAARTQAIPAKVSRGALDRLLAHTWPGNVRELQHVIERAVAIYAHGRALTADHIEQALGIQTPRATSSALSVRQQELITLVHQSAKTCTVDDLFAQSNTLSEGMGKSKRTLQNDLRKLADMGYLTWQKRGSARTYDVTPRGAEVASQ